ncbi:MAG: hypothetical protein FWC75_07235 [Oscillospiraceae bacterium]|nr:hypothetical protein [Oscillospiraceae bacterium]
MPQIKHVDKGGKQIELTNGAYIRFASRKMSELEGSGIPSGRFLGLVSALLYAL